MLEASAPTINGIGQMSSTPAGIHGKAAYRIGGPAVAAPPRLVVTHTNSLTVQDCGDHVAISVLRTSFTNRRWQGAAELVMNYYLDREDFDEDPEGALHNALAALIKPLLENGPGRAAVHEE